MFTQSCLIRKNTKELRDKLRELGYKIAPKPYFEGRPRGILCRPDVAIGIPEDCYEFNLDKYLKDNPHIVDCGNNEQLFIALASLRDDTNMNQIFVLDADMAMWNNPNVIQHKKGTFIKCIRYKWNVDEKNPEFSNRNFPAHKASVQELIHHFKK